MGVLIALGGKGRYVALVARCWHRWRGPGSRSGFAFRNIVENYLAACYFSAQRTPSRLPRTRSKWVLHRKVMPAYLGYGT